MRCTMKLLAVSSGKMENLVTLTRKLFDNIGSKSDRKICSLLTLMGKDYPYAGTA